MQKALVSFFILFSLPLWGAGPLKGLKNDSSFVKNADSMTWNKETNALQLKGHVQIIYQAQHFSCDEASFNMQTKELDAKGNVILRSPTIYAEADRIVAKLSDNIGTLYNGYVQSGQVSFEGTTIYRHGENDFEVVDGKYTACTTCPPAWSFSGSKVKASFGGYARISNPILRISNFPIFWMPYLIVPLKSDRQSGLLFPTFGFGGNDGTTLAESFFWATSKSTDATFTIKNYSKRGIKGLANYRYVLTPTSGGSADFAYIKDKRLGSDSRISEEPGTADLKDQKIDRYGIRYNHYYEMPNGYVHRTNLNLVRELLYISDFRDELPFYGSPAIENKMSLTKNSERSHSSFEVDYYTNLMKSNAFADNRDAVHRFPEIRQSLTQTPIQNTKLLFSFDANYVNFTRDQYAYDKIVAPNTSITDPTNGNLYRGVNSSYPSSYQKGSDQIRTGQRIDFQPTLSYPIQLSSVVDVLPSISYRETDYQFPIGDQPTAYRNYIRNRISTRLHMAGIFGDLENVQSERYKHEVQPEVIYTNIPSYYRSQHPFFGTENKDPYYRSDQALTDGTTMLQFDHNDRMTERNLATFVLTNTLTEKNWVDGQANYKQFLIWKLAQSYDFYEETRTDTQARQVWSDVSSYLNLSLKHYELYSELNFYPYEGVVNNTSRVRFLDDKADYLQLGYQEKFTINRGLPIDYTTRTEDYQLNIGTNLKYLTFSGGLSYSNVVFAVRAYNYAIVIKPPGDCWSIQLVSDAPTNAPPSYTFNFSMVFDGKNSIGIKGPSLNSSTN